jgi:hypothetical protein
LAALSVITFVGSLIAIPLVVLRLPADYFSPQRRQADRWRGRHPVARIVLKVLKNLCGFILVLAGIIMSIPPMPGQGLLTILIGLSLMDFPGKLALELRIVRLKPVHKGINWIRAKWDKPPLAIPGPEAA